jgi:hypothetical protein
MRHVKEHIRIRGLGFFFFQLHGQIGEAPNALEIALMVKIEWLAPS